MKYGFYVGYSFVAILYDGSRMEFTSEEEAFEYFKE